MKVKRVYRIWRRGAQGSNETAEARASVARGRVMRANEADAPNHVWSYDFVQDRTMMASRSACWS